jgi:hypothetical protein
MMAIGIFMALSVMNILCIYICNKHNGLHKPKMLRMYLLWHKIMQVSIMF